MLVRRAFYRWMVPAAFVLPLWLLVGWVVFAGGALGYLWVVILGAPAVLLGQLVLSLLVRARGTVRAERAVSGWDVAGFAVWHVLTIAAGVYNPAFFGWVVVGAILAAVGLFWLTLWELWSEARPSVVLRRTLDGVLYVPPPASEPAERPTPNGREVIVVQETRPPGA